MQDRPLPAADAPPVSTLPTAPTVASIPALPAADRPKGPQLSIAFVFFGVLLPIATLLFEMATHSSATSLFDPVPSWLHVALIALVPGSNFLIYLCWQRGHSSHPRALFHANAAAMVVAFIYAVLYVPFMPIALIGVIFGGIGLMPLAPLISFILTWRARRALVHVVPENVVPSPWLGVLGALLLFGVPAAWEHETESWLHTAMHGSAEEQARAVQRLRAFGDWDMLLARCYRGPRWEWNGSWMNARRSNNADGEAAGRSSIAPLARRLTRGRRPHRFH